MSAESKTRNLDWLRADYLRTQGQLFEHFYCPMLMKDEPTERMLGHVVNEKFEDVPEYRLVQRKDIDGWYGSMFEADFLNLVRFQKQKITDLFSGGKPRRRKKNDHKTPPVLKPVIMAGEQEIDYYYLSDKLDELPINEHTLLEMNSQNGDFLRLALKKTPDEVRALQHVKWRSEVFGDFRVAVLVSCIKAAYLTLFWKLGYSYTLSAAGMSVGRDILGRFYLENHGKEKEAVQVAAVEFFRPYINMLRPVVIAGDEAPKGTIEDNRVFIWLGSSRRGLGIGVFIRADKRLQCVLMPAYNDAEGAATYHDFLHNDKHELWVREGQFNEATGAWDANPQRIGVLWPKTHRSFDLSRTPKDILALQPPPSTPDASDSTANPPSTAGSLGRQSPA